MMSSWRLQVGLWHQRAERVGAASICMAMNVHRFFHFLGGALARVGRLQWLGRPAVKHVLIRQLYFTGVQGLPWILVIALCAGVLMVYTIVIFAKGVEDMSLIGELVNKLLLQEVAPLAVAVLLLARSGVAVVTEIGYMHIRGEPLLLASLGIDLDAYLHVPRLVAFALCGLILTVVFVGASLWVGGLAVAMAGGLPFAQFLAEVQHGASLGGAVLMVTKAAIYPLLCCAMLLFQGCQVGSNPNQVPVRVTNGVLGSLMIVILADAAIGVGQRLW